MPMAKGKPGCYVPIKGTGWLLLVGPKALASRQTGYTTSVRSYSKGVTSLIRGGYNQRGNRADVSWWIR